MLLGRAHCEPAALETSGGSEPAALGKEAQVRHPRHADWPIRPVLRGVGHATTVCTPADEVSDSSHARAWAQTRRRGDGATRLPGAASWWRCPATDTAHAADRSDNCGCWPHRQHADFHRPRGVAHEQKATALLDSEASHQAGEETLGPRSDLSSRKWP